MSQPLVPGDDFLEELEGLRRNHLKGGLLRPRPHYKTKEETAESRRRYHQGGDNNHRFEGERYLNCTDKAIRRKQLRKLIDEPEVNRLCNAFCAGAKGVNDKVKCKFSFIGSFFDPPKAKEAAIAQIEAGVDVIYAERFGVIEAARERGVVAIGNMSDQSSLGPDTVVTSVVWDMWPTVKQVVSLVKAGVFSAQDFGQFSYMGKGGSFLAPYHGWDKKLPDDVKKLVASRKQEILDGTFRIDINESAPKSE